MKKKFYPCPCDYQDLEDEIVGEPVEVQPVVPYQPCPWFVPYNPVPPCPYIGDPQPSPWYEITWSSSGNDIKLEPNATNDIIFGDGHYTVTV